MAFRLASAIRQRFEELSSRGLVMNCPRGHAGSPEPPPRPLRPLSELVRERRDEILLDWERAVRRLPVAQNLDKPALIDRIPEILDWIAAMADELASGGAPSLPKDVSKHHATDRLEEGFELSQVVIEFALLRDSIGRLWEREQLPQPQLAELRLLNQAIDKAVSESVHQYARARDRALEGLCQTAATRARQQEAVAKLGVFALEKLDLQRIVQRAVEVVADTLGTELAKVLELLPDGESLVLRAGVGWKEGLVDRVTVGAGRDSQAGYTLLSAEPVVVEDLRTETRFIGPAMLHEHGAVSGMSVIIHAPGHEGRPYGVFATHTLARRAFSPDDVNFLQAVANVVATAIARRKTEEELHAAEKRLSLYPEQVRLLAVLADSVPLLVSYIDSELRYQFNNKAYEAWFGRSREEIRGKHVRDVLGETAYTMLRAYFDAALSGRPVTYEHEVPYKTGGTRYIEASYTPDFALDGSVAGLVAIISDITERKRMEGERARLLEAETKTRGEAERALAILDSLLAASSVGIAFIDTQLRYVRINDALAEMNGVPAAQHIGRTVGEILGPEAHLIELTVRQVIETREPVANLELDAPLRPGLGGKRSFLVNYFPVLTPRREVLGVGGIIVNISERKRMEERQRFLKDATAELASTLDFRETLARIARLAVPVLADWCAVEIVTDGGQSEQLALEHVEPSKVRLAQELRRRYPPDPDAPRGIRHVFRVGQPELYEEIPDDLLVQTAKNPEHLEMLRELGMKSAILVPMVAHGRTIGVISFLSAESGRRYAQYDLEVTQELAARSALALDNARLFREAQSAVRVREEILAVVSHDLKNPLAAIHLAAALLLRLGASDPRWYKQVETIQRSASRMNHLIGDLLDMASIQAGRLGLERKPEAAGPLVAEALDMHEPAAREKGIQSLRIGELKGEYLLCDRDRVLQVFGNLLGNAIKFCRSGDVITVRGEIAGVEARFSVSDTGPGIPEKELPHIFEPYWSAERHAKKGTGLGLYISKGIIEAHGGRLWVESTPGEGTTFYFTLPLASAKATSR